MKTLKHLIKEGGLKRGEICTVIAPSSKPIYSTNNKELQLTLENLYVKQDSTRSN